MPVQTKSRTKQVSKTSRLAVTFSRDDSMMNRIKSLTNKYQGLSVNEIFKVAIIELDNKTPIRTEVTPYEAINQPRGFTKNEIAESERILAKSRASFKKWYLANGHSEKDYKNLSDQDVYEIVANAK